MSDICREDLRVRYPHTDRKSTLKEQFTPNCKNTVILKLTIMLAEPLLTFSDPNTLLEFYRDGKISTQCQCSGPPQRSDNSNIWKKQKIWASALNEKRLNSTAIRGEASDPRAGGAEGCGSALLQRPGSTDRLVFKSLSLIFSTLKLKKAKQMKPLKHLDWENASAPFSISGKKQKNPSDLSFNNKMCDSLCSNLKIKHCCVLPSFFYERHTLNKIADMLFNSHVTQWQTLL